MAVRCVMIALLSTMVAYLAPNIAYARSLSPQEKASVRDVVIKDFKDPDSAKFKWLPFSQRRWWLSDSQHAGRSKFLSCGLVNAKNSFGGYIGYTPYAVGIALEKNKIVEIELVGIAQGNQALIDYIPALCKGSGQDTAQAR